MTLEIQESISIKAAHDTEINRNESTRAGGPAEGKKTCNCGTCGAGGWVPVLS